MTYEEAIDYLYNSLPVFQHSGPGAYKPGLERISSLDQLFGHPSKGFKSVHIAGTNGKGSTAHSLAAVLQSAGYRTGLYTSPHLHDFRERIRIDGEMIPQERVADFVERYRGMDAGIDLSFFELTTIMAFEYFRDEKVDVAIIETGLGGRLDATNIITPLLSIITNISADHTALLGYTPAAIAAEKAGIIKDSVPVVIGEADDKSVREVFEKTAAERNAPLYFARVVDGRLTADGHISYRNTIAGDFTGDLGGEYQLKNMATILTALPILKQHFTISDAAIRHGLSDVAALTGLRGRWMKIASHPLTICDTGHNPGGWEYITRQLQGYPCQKHIVIGFVADKDVDEIMKMIAARIKDATFYFTAPSVERRLDELELQHKAVEAGISGDAYHIPAEALAAARQAAAPDELIFIGGSNYLLSELVI
ncbi:MAG: bifunctional folylpolyglutamate synthase/dihydrofolate synthase [Lachnoclostridium sp.]|nr:bifunctional folylpolyglutamate synthase/dihydrofolate synthase [Lachnoclostridium sp.]